MNGAHPLDQTYSMLGTQALEGRHLVAKRLKKGIGKFCGIKELFREVAWLLLFCEVIMSHPAFSRPSIRQFSDPVCVKTIRSRLA